MGSCFFFFFFQTTTKYAHIINVRIFRNGEITDFLKSEPNLIDCKLAFRSQLNVRTKSSFYFFSPMICFTWMYVIGSTQQKWSFATYLETRLPQNLSGTIPVEFVKISFCCDTLISVWSMGNMSCLHTKLL